MNAKNNNDTVPVSDFDQLLIALRNIRRKAANKTENHRADCNCPMCQIYDIANNAIKNTLTS